LPLQARSPSAPIQRRGLSAAPQMKRLKRTGPGSHVQRCRIQLTQSTPTGRRIRVQSCPPLKRRFWTRPAEGRRNGLNRDDLKWPAQFVCAGRFLRFVKNLAGWQHYMAATKSGSISGALACKSRAMRAAIPVYIEATWKAFSRTLSLAFSKAN